MCASETKLTSAPWPLQPRRRVVLAPALCAGIERYAAIAAARSAVVAEGLPFDKRRKSVHRMTIADTRGPLMLTAPIARPVSTRGARWADIRLSSHGDWWQQHLTALESAYGRTPFFEFYIDRFAPLYSAFPDMGVTDFDAAFDAEICRILGLEPPRRDASLAERPDLLELPAGICYWQVRQGSLGFISGLSILDLIFNMGPESPLVVLRAARAMFAI